jgi:hypothetical protein
MVDFKKAREQRQQTTHEIVKQVDVFIVPEDTVPPLHRPTVSPSQGDTRSLKTKKISFYLTPAEEKKLDDFAYQYTNAHEKRVNRSDLVRYLIDHCELKDFQEL